MRRLQIIWILLLPFVLGRCYEDKGSYDYKEMNKPQVAGLEGSYAVGLGDELDIRPEITFPLNNDSGIKYEWNVGGKIISTEKNLYIPQYSGEIGTTYCSFNIINEAENVTYMNTFNLRVSPTYSVGWLILSEKDGNTSISYIRPKEQEKDGKAEYTFEEFPDAYFKNTGVILGKSPVKLMEHWCFNYSVMGEVLVLNGEGDCVELDGGALTKKVAVKQEFIGEAYPRGFKAKDATFSFNNSYLISEDGKMYSRKSEDVGNYHTGLYGQEPVYVADSLSIKFAIPAKFMNAYHMLVYDGYNRRLIWIAYDTYQPGKINPLVYAADPKFTNLGDMGDKDLVYCGYYKVSDFATSGYFALLKSDAGQYYVRDFKLYSYIFSAMVTDNYEMEFPGASLIKPDSKFLSLPLRKYFFLSSGDVLYYYDKATLEKAPKRYVGFDGVRITSIQSNKDNNQIAVGLENGKFYIYDITDKSLAGGEPQLVYEAETNFGKIVDVIYKYGTLLNYM